MSKIDELIQEFCPDGVKSKNLSSLGRRNKGTPITASRMKELHQEGSPIRIFAGGKTVADFPADALPEKNIINKPSIIVKSRGHIGFEYYDKPFSHKNELWSYTINTNGVDQKFVYYYLLTKVKSLQELARATSVKLPQLSVKDTDSLKIPVPPIEVQKEIVNILDKFTQLEAELSAELSAELDARLLQYEYYRNHLLAYEKSDSDIKWASLSDVTLSTKNIKWREVGSASYEYIDLSSVSRDDHSIIETTKVSSSTAPSRAQKLVQDGDIIFATTRPTLQRYTMINNHFDGQVASTGYCVLRPNKEIVTSQWIYHNIAKSDFNNYVEKNQEGSAYPSISDSKVKAFVIPVPPISEQQRIVTLLDRFEQLVNDISIGLPAEIKSRHNQYEYYRTKLLTFQELSA